MWNHSNRRAILLALLTAALVGCNKMLNAAESERNATEVNRAVVQAAFDKWRVGQGSPFDLLLPEAKWTIVGSSPLSKIYRSKQQFMDEVITPFNARVKSPLVPTVQGLYADGDTVIICFDGATTALDGLPYRNTYTWYFTMKDGKVVKATAFFDTRVFDEFWNRVSPPK
ncbi:nuclear transport factor 2 family protein [Leptolyngbya sp. FACHB-321]|uniref:nuclear transport factor 2 family protein n=1 Tax=Leptolyngbya sp. FACHB-321 TaxID=2692807 RepID=UPI0018EFCB52|nr:nuclear transport factor 2 family protein [Leptolyngbya sp. FACHB-321]